MTDDIAGTPPPDDPADQPALHAAIRAFSDALEAKAEGRDRDAVRHAASVTPLLIEHILGQT